MKLSAYSSLSKLSGTYQSARWWQEAGIAGKIRIVDTLNAAWRCHFG